MEQGRAFKDQSTESTGNWQWRIMRDCRHEAWGKEAQEANASHVRMKAEGVG